MDRRNGADAVFETLRAWDIERLFVCPGSTEAALLDAAVRHPEIELVLGTHEAVTIAMADGYARTTRRPAVALVHANVGLANALSNMIAARLGHSPLVILNGLKPTLLQSRRGFTTSPDMRELVRQTVKSEWLTLSADALSEDLARALRVATSEPTGPVWLGLSQDHVTAPFDGPVRGPSRGRQGPCGVPAEELRRAATLLDQARRPLIVAGSEVARHGATGQLIALADAHGIPVVNEDYKTIERAGFPTAHPAFRGFYAPTSEVVRAADVILFLGTRCFVETEVPPVPAVPAAARVIHSHVDPQCLEEVYDVDVPLVGDERVVLAGLATLLSRGPDLWAAPPASAPVPPRGGEPMSVAEVMAVLGRRLPEQAHVVSDATTATRGLLEAVPFAAPDGLYATSSGNLGWGMGAALGVQLAHPEAAVVAVVGDGVFQFGVQALWAAARYRLPVVFVVLNNGSYAAVAAAVRRFRLSDGRDDRSGGEAPEYPCKDISGADPAAIARGFGVPGITVRSSAELDEAFTKSLDRDGPLVLDVLVDDQDLGPI